MEGIKGYGQVEEYFGYWPKFCDARINKFLVDINSKVIESSVYYIDSDLGKEGEISFVFSDVSNVQICDLLDENIVDEISIIKVQKKYNVKILACYGLRGVFSCNSINVKLKDKI
jgi:hypothetical protein